MSKRELPAAEIATRPGLKTVVAPSALDRWNPDVHAATEEDATISVLDVIGGDIWGEGVTAKRIDAALRKIGSKEVTVNINSPGGDYFEGLAIYNRLREHPARVTVKILGVAASAASVIAMAGDEIRIARAGFMMIHNTWVLAMGDRHQLREVADWLEPFDIAAVDVYAARTGLDTAEIGAMLDKETWIGGAAAVDKGFADSLLAADEVTSDLSNRATTGKPLAAVRKIDILLAKAGVAKSERRELLASLTGGMSGAAPTGMSGAAVVAEVQGLLEYIRKI